MVLGARFAGRMVILPLALISLSMNTAQGFKIISSLHGAFSKSVKFPEGQGALCLSQPLQYCISTDKYTSSLHINTTTPFVLEAVVFHRCYRWLPLKCIILVGLQLLLATCNHILSCIASIIVHGIIVGWHGCWQWENWFPFQLHLPWFALAVSPEVTCTPGRWSLWSAGYTPLCISCM